MSPDYSVLKSYAFHNGACFFISTIERDSSAMEGPRRFWETIVWAYDWAKRERGGLLHTASDSIGSLREHMRVCEAYVKTGQPPEELT